MHVACGSREGVRGERPAGSQEPTWEEGQRATGVWSGEARVWGRWGSWKWNLAAQVSADLGGRVGPAA